ncbi:MAG: microcin C ABC transporter permease YejB [Desulfobacterales bacterium]
MLLYIIRRILLMIPTLIGILLVNFLIIQAAPGGPVDQAIARLRGDDVSATANLGTSEGGMGSSKANTDSESGSSFDSARGIDPEMIKELEKQFGFDKPAHVRFFKMLIDFSRFEFGDSFYQDRPVVELVKERLPVSISLGLWTFLIVYTVSIPLGIKKAVKDGESFDVWSSAVIFVGYAVPSFLVAMMLIVLLSGGEFLDIFPLRGLTSEGFSELGTWAKIKDYVWHMSLPVAAMVAGGFATLTMLTKNSFLEEINKQYVMTARAKGLTPNRVLYGHVFRNAMIIVIAGFPRAFIAILFTGVLLIEIIFSLQGLGLLGYEAVLTRDYPIVFGTLFVFTLIGLSMQLISDITYTLVDPRIDFETREV